MSNDETMRETTRTIPASELIESLREAFTKMIDEKYGAITPASMRNLWHATLIIALDAGVNAMAPGEGKPTAEESLAIYDESLDVIERSMEDDHRMAVTPHTDRHVFRRRLGLFVNRFLMGKDEREEQSKRRGDVIDAMMSMIAAILGAVRKGKPGQKLDATDVAWVKRSIIESVTTLEYTDELGKPATH